MSHARDKQLVRRVLRKDERAFDEFFDGLFPSVYRFCRARMGGECDRADVDDIVQETMLKAVKGLATYRGEASLFTWVCQICRHEMARWRQREERAAGPRLEVSFGTGLLAGDSSSGDELERRLTGEVVQTALGRLPVEYALALERKYLLGWTVAEVARDLGRTRIATQSLLARARRSFARCYLELLEGDQGEQE